jgi:hypothetical protein
MNVDPKLINVIKAMYKKPCFKVEMEGETSQWHNQETGIRQGCPLSPYLFLIVMTVMFHDIHEGDKQNLTKHRIQSTNYDEVLYADDTICISTDTRALNKLLADIETEGLKYGLRLNKTKCEVMGNKPRLNIHFKDGTLVTRREEVKYLGCHLNQACNTTREISTKISTCMVTLKKLDTFWAHSSCPTKIKLGVLDAVIRSKLLYGLESAQLNQPELNRLNTFQLKGLRKIMRMQTTFVNRENTNALVLEKANEAFQTRAGHKQIQLYSEAYKMQRVKSYVKLLNADQNDPARRTTFTQDLKPIDYANKRHGRPKLRWATETAKMYWSIIQSNRPAELQELNLNLDNEDHRNIIFSTAKQTERRNENRHENRPQANARNLKPHELMFSAAEAGLHIS